jgi:hypothetical protein
LHWPLLISKAAAAQWFLGTRPFLAVGVGSWLLQLNMEIIDLAAGGCVDTQPQILALNPS